MSVPSNSTQLSQLRLLVGQMALDHTPARLPPVDQNSDEYTQDMKEWITVLSTEEKRDVDVIIDTQLGRVAAMLTISPREGIVLPNVDPQLYVNLMNAHRDWFYAFTRNTLDADSLASELNTALRTLAAAETSIHVPQQIASCEKCSLLLRANQRMHAKLAATHRMYGRAIVQSAQFGAIAKLFFVRMSSQHTFIRRMENMLSVSDKVTERAQNIAKQATLAAANLAMNTPDQQIKQALQTSINRVQHLITENHKLRRRVIELERGGSAPAAPSHSPAAASAPPPQTDNSSQLRTELQQAQTEVARLEAEFIACQQRSENRKTKRDEFKANAARLLRENADFKAETDRLRLENEELQSDAQRHLSQLTEAHTARDDAVKQLAQRSSVSRARESRAADAPVVQDRELAKRVAMGEDIMERKPRIGDSESGDLYRIVIVRERPTPQNQNIVHRVTDENERSILDNIVNQEDLDRRRQFLNAQRDAWIVYDQDRTQMEVTLVDYNNRMREIKDACDVIVQGLEPIPQNPPRHVADLQFAQDAARSAIERLGAATDEAVDLFNRVQRYLPGGVAQSDRIALRFTMERFTEFFRANGADEAKTYMETAMRMRQEMRREIQVVEQLALAVTAIRNEVLAERGGGPGIGSRQAIAPPRQQGSYPLISSQDMARLLGQPGLGNVLPHPPIAPAQAPQQYAPVVPRDEFGVVDRADAVEMLHIVHDIMLGALREITPEGDMHEGEMEAFGRLDMVQLTTAICEGLKKQWDIINAMKLTQQLITTLASTIVNERNHGVMSEEMQEALHSIRNKFATEGQTAALAIRTSILSAIGRSGNGNPVPYSTAERDQQLIGTVLAQYAQIQRMLQEVAELDAPLVALAMIKMVTQAAFINEPNHVRIVWDADVFQALTDTLGKFTSGVIKGAHELREITTSAIGDAIHLDTAMALSTLVEKAVWPVGNNDNEYNRHLLLLIANAIEDNIRDVRPVGRRPRKKGDEVLRDIVASLKEYDKDRTHSKVALKWEPCMDAIYTLAVSVSQREHVFDFNVEITRPSIDDEKGDVSWIRPFAVAMMNTMRAYDRTARELRRDIQLGVFANIIPIAVVQAGNDIEFLRRIARAAAGGVDRMVAIASASNQLVGNGRQFDVAHLGAGERIMDVTLAHLATVITNSIEMKRSVRNAITSGTPPTRGDADLDRGLHTTMVQMVSDYRGLISLVEHMARTSRFFGNPNGDHIILGTPRSAIAALGLVNAVIGDYNTFAANVRAIADGVDFPVPQNGTPIAEIRNLLERYKQLNAFARETDQHIWGIVNIGSVGYEAPGASFRELQTATNRNRDTLTAFVFGANQLIANRPRSFFPATANTVAARIIYAIQQFGLIAEACAGTEAVFGARREGRGQSDYILRVFEEYTAVITAIRVTVMGDRIPQMARNRVVENPDWSDTIRFTMDKYNTLLMGLNDIIADRTNEHAFKSEPLATITTIIDDLVDTTYNLRARRTELVQTINRIGDIVLDEEETKTYVVDTIVRRVSARIGVREMMDAVRNTAITGLTVDIDTEMVAAARVAIQGAGGGVNVDSPIANQIQEVRRGCIAIVKMYAGVFRVIGSGGATNLDELGVHDPNQGGGGGRGRGRDAGSASSSAVATAMARSLNSYRSDQVANLVSPPNPNQRGDALTRIAIRVLFDFARCVAGLLRTDVTAVFTVSTSVDHQDTQAFITRALNPNIPLIPPPPEEKEERADGGSAGLLRAHEDRHRAYNDKLQTIHNASENALKATIKPQLDEVATRWIDSSAVWEAILAASNHDNQAPFIELLLGYTRAYTTNGHALRRISEITVDDVQVEEEAMATAFTGRTGRETTVQEIQPQRRDRNRGGNARAATRDRSEDTVGSQPTMTPGRNRALGAAESVSTSPESGHSDDEFDDEPRRPRQRRPDFHPDAFGPEDPDDEPDAGDFDPLGYQRQMRRYRPPPIDIVPIASYTDFERSYANYLKPAVVTAIESLLLFGRCQAAPWAAVSMFDIMASPTSRILLAQAIATSIVMTDTRAPNGPTFNIMETRVSMKALSAARDALASRVKVRQIARLRANPMAMRVNLSDPYGANYIDPFDVVVLSSR